MRRPILTALAVCSLGAWTVPVAAQEPSPSVPATKYADDYLRLAEELLEELHVSDVRYEFPEAGLAIAFPGDWYTLESELGWGTLLEARSLSDPEYCYVQANPVLREDASVADAAQVLTATYTGEGYAEIDSTPILLPAGAAWRVDAVTESGPLAVYVVMSDEVLVALQCLVVRSDGPADRWLSIAETIEFLPEEE